MVVAYANGESHWIQVGYGISNDLRAISAAVGPEGGSCIAVLRPVIEIRILIRHLRRQYQSSAPKVRLSPGGGGREGCANPSCDINEYESKQMLSRKWSWRRYCALL